VGFPYPATPARVNLFVAFVDMLGYAELARRTPDPLQLFDLMNDLAKIVVRNVEATSGVVIKFIGDACLLAFGVENADECVLSIRTLVAQCEQHLRQTGRRNKFKATVHFGEVAIGLFGLAPQQRIDVLGDPVNKAATLGNGIHRGGIILSTQAFERLSDSTKTLFRKTTSGDVYTSE
jgi:class 3 adenylate cyclase